MSGDNFSCFWKRAVLRRVKNEYWLIDPYKSYGSGEKQIITLNIPKNNKFGNDYVEIKNSLDQKTLNKIKAEYENISNDRFGFSRLECKKLNQDYRLPWKVGIELTTKCNFRCMHCYAKPLRNIIEPSFDKIISLINRLFEAGTIWLWFTGGECTMRKDFIDIYKYAKQKGFLVTVLTNGSLISDELIALFKRYPPLVVKLSQYGATKETYKAITGSETNFYLFNEGINKLKKNNINIMVQNIVVKTNMHEIGKMISICESMNVQHNLNISMIPRLNGDIFPLEIEANDDQILDKNKEKLIEYFKNNLRETRRIRNKFIRNNEFYCGAGINYCFIGADMTCMPCFIARDYGINLNLDKRKFSDIFDSLSKVRKKILSIPVECKKCKALIICNSCKLKRELYSENEEYYNNKCKEMIKVYEKI